MESVMEEIVLFGTGKYFWTKIHSIQENYKINVCIDNSIMKLETTITDTGLTVINPSDLSNDSAPIFLMSVRFIPMWKQLIDQGIDPDRIVYPYFIMWNRENDL